LKLDRKPGVAIWASVINVADPAPNDRMPVVLDEKDYGRWLDGSDNPKDLLKACHNEVIYNYPVSRQVNSVRNNDPSLVVPLESEAVSPDHPAKPA
jgi:hypothetical protein